MTVPFEALGVWHPVEHPAALIPQHIQNRLFKFSCMHAQWYTLPSQWFLAPGRLYAYQWAY
jgi:hypothetical protein